MDAGRAGRAGRASCTVRTRHAGRARGPSRTRGTGRPSRTSGCGRREVPDHVDHDLGGVLVEHGDVAEHAHRHDHTGGGRTARVDIEARDVREVSLAGPSSQEARSARHGGETDRHGGDRTIIGDVGATHHRHECRRSGGVGAGGDSGVVDPGARARIEQTGWRDRHECRGVRHGAVLGGDHDCAGRRARQQRADRRDQRDRDRRGRTETGGVPATPGGHRPSDTTAGGQRARGGPIGDDGRLTIGTRTHDSPPRMVVRARDEPVRRT